MTSFGLGIVLGGLGGRRAYPNLIHFSRRSLIRNAVTLFVCRAPTALNAQPNTYSESNKSCVGQSFDLYHTYVHCAQASVDRESEKIIMKTNSYIDSICSSAYSGLNFSDPTDIGKLAERVVAFNSDQRRRVESEMACDEQGALSAIRDAASDADWVEQYLKYMAGNQGRSALATAFLRGMNAYYVMAAGAGQLPSMAIPENMSEIMESVGKNAVGAAVPALAGNIPPNNPMVLIWFLKMIEQ